MRIFSSIVSLALLSLVWISNADAQSRPVTAQEYIESTSPLKDGGAVTSRSIPGAKVQTVTSIANLPVAGASNNRVVSNSGSAAGNASASRSPNAYPYPANTPPRLAGNFGTAAVSRNPGTKFAPRVASVSNTNTFRQTAFQANSLGLPPVPTARTAQNCNCGTAQAPPQFYQPPAANQAPALGAPPNLNIQVPGQPAAGGYAQPGFQPGFQQPGQLYQPNYQFQPGVGTPQFGAASGGSVLTPFLTGSGRYTPVLNFRNMPPGTYLGQGIIGQPTAYVDGQAFRNLLRYLSP